MNDSEIYGRTLRVNIARPKMLKEGSAKAVWTEDSWLKRYAGKGEEERETGSDGGKAAATTEPSDGGKTAATTEPSEGEPPTKKRAKPRCYLEVAIGAESCGRVVVELNEDLVPRAAENFRALCTGEKGVGYKGCPFHRIIPQFMCQGGDFTNQNGTGGRSIYGNKFDDENFSLKHTGRGTLSMANSGPNTNGSQFFICLAKTDWLDGKHVVFGRVVEGMEVLDKMEAVGTQSGKTSRQVVITDCGEI